MNWTIPALCLCVIGGPAATLAGPVNQPPPAGSLLDLAGQAISHATAQQYSVDFIATLTSTTISFAMREDQAKILFSDPSVIDTSSGGSNLLTNPAFGAGTYTSNFDSLTPIGWTYANPDNTHPVGEQIAGCGALANTNCWGAGAVQGYDILSQSIATIVGDTYRISFYALDPGSSSVFSDLSTNGDTTDEGGNGADILAYAQGGISVPEPGSVLLFGIGVLGVGLLRKRRPGSLVVSIS